MFIGRRPDGSIYGTWTVRQADDADHPGQEEVASDHPDVLFFIAERSRAQTADELEAAVLAALNGGGSRFDLLKLLKAKFISDLAWRLGVAPGALTLAQLNAERQRIANIYKAL